jgi:hypothetical protein
LYVARERGVTEEEDSRETEEAEQSDATAELSTLPPGESKTEQPHRLARPLQNPDVEESENENPDFEESENENTDFGSLETPE